MSEIREPIDTDIAEFRSLLKEKLGQAISDMDRIHFNAEDPQHLLAISLYATIVQSAHDCSILLDEETVTIVGGALRSIVESWADLTCIIVDRNYGQRMNATYAHEKVRYLQNMLKYPSNSFFADMSRHLDAEIALKAATAELEQLASEGHKKTLKRGTSSPSGA